MKLLGKKTKTVSEPCDACVSESLCKSDNRLFKVSAVLSECMFNKELGRWLFVNPETNEITITESPNIEFIATGSLYRYYDNMYSGKPFYKVTIEKIENEKV